MNTDVGIDPGDPTPPFEQLRRRLAELIEHGALPDGTRLAPVRQLAADLDLATGTVARAYRELEAAGLVETRRGAGTRVRSDLRADDRAGRLATLARGYVADARDLGDDDAILAAVRRALHPRTA